MNLSDKYKINGELGDKRNRKFGELYLGIDNSNSDPVVLKAVRKNVHSESAINRIVHEARFNFDFPGLPKIKDIYESENEVILVREHIEGEQLDKVFKKLKRRHRLPFLLDLVENLIPIFTHLSEKGIVQADIKPGNIIVKRTPDEFQVNLIDFGLAIDCGVPDNRGTLFPLGYAAPELLLNHLDIVDQSTDQFALGVTIWKLFCESIPLTHPNPSIMTNLQLTYPLPDHPSLPKGLYKILSKMCAKYQFSKPPNQLSPSIVKENLRQAQQLRYSSFNEILDELQKLKPNRFFYQKRSFR